jgi:hypothetical protein
MSDRQLTGNDRQRIGKFADPAAITPPANTDRQPCGSQSATQPPANTEIGNAAAANRQSARGVRQLCGRSPSGIRTHCRTATPTGNHPAIVPSDAPPPPGGLRGGYQTDARRRAAHTLDEERHPPDDRRARAAATAARTVGEGERPLAPAGRADRRQRACARRVGSLRLLRERVRGGSLCVRCSSARAGACTGGRVVQSARAT